MKEAQTLSGDISKAFNTDWHRPELPEPSRAGIFQGLNSLKTARRGEERLSQI